MTDFKSHEGMAFNAVNAYVVPEQVDGTAYADKVVIETEEQGEISFKPRFEQEEEKKVNGVKVKDTVKSRYAIARLPESVKQVVNEVNDSDGVTYTATVGEAIQEGGSCSFFISQNNFETLEKNQQTVFDPEEDVADEFAEKEVNA